jgi:hypothetical protein
MEESMLELAERARRLAKFACTREDRAKLLEIAANFEREAKAAKSTAPDPDVAFRGNSGADTANHSASEEISSAF